MAKPHCLQTAAKKSIRDLNPWEEPDFCHLYFFVPGCLAVQDWTFEWLDTPPLTVAACANVLGLPVRHIQHCRILDLYWQFSAEWEVLQSKRPDVGEMPSYQVFCRRYKSHWRHILLMRKTSQHGQCKRCFDLQLLLRDPKVHWEAKARAVKNCLYRPQK